MLQSTPLLDGAGHPEFAADMAEIFVANWQVTHGIIHTLEIRNPSFAADTRVAVQYLGRGNT